MRADLKNRFFGRSSQTLAGAASDFLAFFLPDNGCFVEEVRQNSQFAFRIACGQRFHSIGQRFKEVMHPAPAFAMLTRGELRLVLSAPNPSAGGGQPMPDGRQQEPGGWNRFAIEVTDLAATVERLRRAAARFRNEIVTGVGGKQILVEDPSGNPIELFEPILPEARLKQPS
jgi:catechol 2,3-dioxygenase-like lactoylglutathione lyase family enzyme